MVDILKWILEAGGFAIIVSWACERWPTFSNLSATTKSLIQFGASLVIALGSYALLTYVPPNVWILVDPWVKIVLGVAAVYGLNQVGHTADPVRIQKAAEAAANVTPPQP
jgi:hypothetical protein